MEVLYEYAEEEASCLDDDQRNDDLPGVGKRRNGGAAGSGCRDTNR